MGPGGRSVERSRAARSPGAYARRSLVGGRKGKRDSAGRADAPGSLVQGGCSFAIPPPTIPPSHQLARQIHSAALIQPVDDRLVRLVDHATLHLQRRRQLAALDGKVVLEQRDLLRRLKMRETVKLIVDQIG